MTIREKILIVEDEKSIAHFISTILTTNGYETILAKTGTEAMTMLSSHCPDLVILGLGLPDMDGIEVLRIPSGELSRGRGGPRCMSMPLCRDC